MEPEINDFMATQKRCYAAKKHKNQILPDDPNLFYDETADFMNRKVTVIVKFSRHNFHKSSLTFF